MICSNCNLETGTKLGKHKSADVCVQALMDELKIIKAEKAKPVKRKVKPLHQSGGVEFGAPKQPKKTEVGNKPASELDIATDGPVHITRLLELLASDPLKEGEMHPAESYMIDLIEKYDEDSYIWFIDIFIMYSYIKPLAAANLIRILPRIIVPSGDEFWDEDISWAVGLASMGVYHPDYQIQSGCIEALEAWATEECVEKLQIYLNDYTELETLPSIGFISKIERVITNIKSVQKTKQQPGRNDRRN